MQRCCIYKDNDYFCNNVALMSAILMIPQKYEQWKNCIVNDSKINLTKDFAQQRLSVIKTIKMQKLKNSFCLTGNNI